MSTYAKPNGQGGYTFYNTGQEFRWSGGMNHKPSSSVLSSEGYLPVIIQSYDANTEKLGNWTDNGTNVYQEVVSMDASELAAREAEYKLTLHTLCENTCTSKINAVVGGDTFEVKRKLAKAARLNRKLLLYIQNPGSNPDLTQDEKDWATTHESMQESTEAIHTSMMLIDSAIDASSGTDLFNFDVVNHPFWP